MARQDDYIRTALRLPPELHKSLHNAADATGKSFNAEIISRIESSFQRSADSGLVLDQAEQIWELRKRVAKGYAVMSAAREALKQEPGTDPAEMVPQLEAAMNEASSDAQAFLLRVLNRSGVLDAGERAVAAKLIAAVADHDFDSAPQGDGGPTRSPNARQPAVKKSPK